MHGGADRCKSATALHCTAPSVTFLYSPGNLIDGLRRGLSNSSRKSKTHPDTFEHSCTLAPGIGQVVGHSTFS